MQPHHGRRRLETSQEKLPQRFSLEIRRNSNCTFFHFFFRKFYTHFFQDLNDRALVTSTLWKVYKEKRPLNCENCGLKKKSVVGFLSHKMQCEKSAEEIGEMKVKCALCGNSMLPVSMQVHMRLSHGSKSQEVSDLIVPKSKRKSAAK